MNAVLFIPQLQFMGKSGKHFPLLVFHAAAVHVVFLCIFSDGQLLGTEATVKQFCVLFQYGFETGIGKFQVFQDSFIVLCADPI